MSRTKVPVKPWTMIYGTKRRAINAARRTYGACRYGDVASLHACLPGYQVPTGVGAIGYVVCPRDIVKGWVAEVHTAAGLLPQEEAVLVAVYHDTLKG